MQYLTIITHDQERLEDKNITIYVIIFKNQKNTTG